MKIIGLCLGMWLLPLWTKAEGDLPREAAEAVRIGTLLYGSEKASWNGTDLFLERFPDKRESIGGYLSYANGSGTTCLFFTDGDQPRSLARFTFDSTFSTTTVVIDTTSGALTTDEDVLWGMRRAALDLVRTDEIFVLFKGMNFNLVPLLDKGDRSVYVISGPKENGVMLFGNDYLITLDKKNKVRSKKKLHQNLIPVEFTTKEGVNIVSSMHSHLPETGDFITATDICTLLLYSPYAPMTQHLVISERYVSIWDCRKGTLTVLSKDAWDRILKDQDERHPKED